MCVYNTSLIYFYIGRSVGRYITRHAIEKISVYVILVKNQYIKNIKKKPNVPSLKNRIFIEIHTFLNCIALIEIVIM